MAVESFRSVLFCNAQPAVWRQRIRLRAARKEARGQNLAAIGSCTLAAAPCFAPAWKTRQAWPCRQRSGSGCASPAL